MLDLWSIAFAIIALEKIKRRDINVKLNLS